MTIREALTKVDRLLTNTYTQEQKINWISQLDQRVKTLIIDTHEGAEDISFSGYDTEIDLDTVLLVPTPFDDIYLHWLEAQIYYYNQEEARCNNAMDTFNMRWSEYWNDYNRKHMPLGQKLCV